MHWQRKMLKINAYLKCLFTIYLSINVLFMKSDMKDNNFNISYLKNPEWPFLHRWSSTKYGRCFCNNFEPINDITYMYEYLQRRARIHNLWKTIMYSFLGILGNKANYIQKYIYIYLFLQYSVHALKKYPRKTLKNKKKLSSYTLFDLWLLWKCQFSNNAQNWIT